MIIRDEAELVRLGAEFAGRLRGGEVIELVGDIGAGKTTFAKGIARTLGVENEVNSPSFTIMKEYQGKIGERSVWLKHYDFYRLDDAGLMRDELVDSLGRDDVVTVVEWAKDVVGVLPDSRLRVEIKYLPDGDGREVEL
jgi:tRNA threonylcarbamoyladenosine biosynthesis protein TsaE